MDARAGLKLVTDKDRIQCKRAITGLNGSITAITAIKARLGRADMTLLRTAIKARLGRANMTLLAVMAL